MKSALALYQTPSRAVRALLRHVDLPDDGYILEPCAGRGNIVRELMKAGHDVVACEINDRFYGGVKDITWVTGDFLRLTKDHFGYFEPCAVVANPPFSKLKDFMVACLKYLVRGNAEVVALLMPINTLCGSNRAKLNLHYPPSCLLTFAQRLEFEDPFGKSIGTPFMDCAWFVWHIGGDPLNIIPV